MLTPPKSMCIRPERAQRALMMALACTRGEHIPQPEHHPAVLGGSIGVNVHLVTHQSIIRLLQRCF